ncbi:uncharacterized protein [Primulina huaijiensis]|uniref:uncharacterized protein n=1 Tax=Primulina huaijiensis TaxID=1492673 RepID=UPI003CC6ED33
MVTCADVLRIFTFFLAFKFDSQVETKMENSLADLSLSVEVEEDLQIGPSNIEHHIESSETCLVGRFLQTKHIHFQSMQNRMAEIWRPVKGVFVREIGDQRYLFHFFHEFDMEWALEGGPWTYDNQLLILKHLKQGDVPTQVDLYTIPFWIQIYELPVGYISEAIGKQLGDFAGRFITYDSLNNAGF